MPTIRQIRNRIRSVKNIAQVTRAMEMISASKMRRAQNAVTASRSYADKAREVLTYVATEPGRSKHLHPLLEERATINSVGIILFTTSRGLAGAYDVNITRKTIDFMNQQKVSAKLLTVGKRGRDPMRRLGKAIIADFTGMGDRPQLAQITALSRAAQDEFLQGRVDQVYVAYTKFVNVLRQEPMIRRILPIERVELKHEGPQAVYLYEPTAEQILAAVLPRFVEVQIYQALLESIASEHAARMVAMRNATDNANELIDSYTLLRNKVRQGAITREMLDIVGGAEALRQTLAAG
jgi:F-type H+-transporting ATPase subunit gamma